MQTIDAMQAIRQRGDWVGEETRVESQQQVGAFLLSLTVNSNGWKGSGEAPRAHQDGASRQGSSIAHRPFETAAAVAWSLPGPEAVSGVGEGQSEAPRSTSRGVCLTYMLCYSYVHT